MVAPRSFGLGLGCGALLACVGFLVHGQWTAGMSPRAALGAGSTVAGAVWHHPAPTGDLVSSVRASARLLPSAGRVVVPPGAAGPGGSVQELLARAEQHRRKREFAAACAVYADVVAQGGMTADAWADYADAQASASGHLAGAPARAIEAALALEPGHPKALWLKASLAHEQHRYADALETWRRLLALVPEGSTDAKIIQANIAEATRLAAG